jgi:hypothetical protein
MTDLGYQPIDVQHLTDVVADRLISIGTDHPLRVAVDGPRAVQPLGFAGSLVRPLRVRGRAAEIIDTETFWRDASVRYESGRTNPEEYRHRWLDADALRREVRGPLGPGGTSCFVRALRDPTTNRSIRAAPVTAPPNAIVLITGELLLGHGLPFDCVIHLALDSGARQRLTAPEWQWTLRAHDAYERDVQPARLAGIVVRCNDPQHPAIRIVNQAQISPDSQQSIR